jgi:hypothetical protein
MMQRKPRPEAVFKHVVWHAVRRDHASLEGHVKGLQDLGGVLHGLPVRLGTHDHADER